MDKETVLLTIIGELYFKVRILEDKLEDKEAEISELQAERAILQERANNG